MKKHCKIFVALVAIFLFQNLASFAKAPEIELANIYYEGIDVSQYLVSEKLDGIRARWTGRELISKNGNKFNAPQWFTKNFPQDELDGELWSERGEFEKISSIVRDKIPSAGWGEVKFMVFDLPKSNQTFEKRLKVLQNIIEKSGSKYLQLIEQFEVYNHRHLTQRLNKITKNRGEGLMLHKKDSIYQARRSDDLLKLKSYEDEEAIVISYIEGKGEFAGKMGALLVENSQKIQFKIGGGFTDEQRKNPPEIGSKITYKFYGKTKNNLPRFPVFLRIKEEI